MQLRGVVVDPDQLLATAERAMGGTLHLPGLAPSSVSLPFASEDLDRGPPAWTLMVATLASADLFLDAYKASGREEFFQQARDSIVAFAQYESARWLDRGAMWNDHAISARIPVLIKFWSEYRDRRDFDPLVGRLVLGLVARSAQLLVKPSFYAWRTSHGILADLALLQIAVAFPQLDESAEAKRVAIKRFGEHLPYFVNNEGVTLLHSAGYHEGSVYHFGLMLRLFTLNGLAIPDEWWSRYTKAVDFYSLLRRPDGTVPMFGDTADGAQVLGPPLTARRASDGAASPLATRTNWPRGDALAVYPGAGHAVWWDHSRQSEPQSATQTTMTWSYHPGLGHKLADELSIMLWSRERTWITNTGYWPYGVQGREQAESWEASNAPHLFGESKHSERTSRVRGQGQGDGISFLDIERIGPQRYSVRRQIARLTNDDLWVVLDHSLDSAAQTTSTNWTFYPDLLVTPLAGKGLYRVSAPNSATGMLCSFSGSEGFGLELTAGSTTPFAGWVVLGRTPTRATAIAVRQPSRSSWSLATFALVDARQAMISSHGARVSEWIDADHWTVVLSGVSGEVRLTRTGNRLATHRPGSGSDAAIDLVARDAPEVDVQAMRGAFRLASETYQKFPELVSYRIKVSYVLLAALTGQELLMFFLRRKSARTERSLRVAAWIGWSIGGLWLSQVYF